MPDITETGRIISSANLDETGRKQINGILETGWRVISIFDSLPPVFDWRGGGWIPEEDYVEDKAGRPYPKRSEAAQKFIDEVTDKIMETGVVRNTHISYDPKTNKRYKVPEHQAEVIAWNIAKSKGMRAGRKPAK